MMKQANSTNQTEETGTRVSLTALSSPKTHFAAVMPLLSLQKEPPVSAAPTCTETFNVCVTV